MFGSSTITLTVSHNGSRRRILFSGDLGRHDKPILSDPDEADLADYVLVESTYGDRIHKPADEVAENLRDIINETV